MPLPSSGALLDLTFAKSPLPGERAKVQFLGDMPWEAGRLRSGPTLERWGKGNESQEARRTAVMARL